MALGGTTNYESGFPTSDWMAWSDEKAGLIVIYLPFGRNPELIFVLKCHKPVLRIGRIGDLRELIYCRILEL